MVYASDKSKGGPFLAIEGISKTFGGVQALFNVSFPSIRGALRA